MKKKEDLQFKNLKKAVMQNQLKTKSVNINTIVKTLVQNNIRLSDIKK